MAPDNSHSQDIVTAVVVAHDGAAWIPRVAQAVAGQTRPVQRVVAVDTGSRDRSGAMLAQAFGRPVVFGMERPTGYGTAVAEALNHRAANTNIPPPPGGHPGERTEWIWLIHDDCEPAPDALERLLLGASSAPAAAVLGPKVMDWADREVLLEAGVTIDRASRRVTGIEPREVDQGQHDGDRDVLAVSSAGMLVRRDVWDQVGGFDTGMRLFREDIDFCWRVQAAGFQVRVITDAVIYHAEASARNRRRTSAAPHPRRQDRRNGLLVLFGNLPAGPLLSAFAGNLVLAVMRTLFFLVAKRPSAALDEFTAFASVACHPMRLLGARHRRARGRMAAYSRLHGDVLSGQSMRKLAEFVANTFSHSPDTVGSHHATDDPSDDDSLLVDNGLVQRLLTSPGVLLFLALIVIAGVAERSLLGGTPLGGGALAPAWGGVSGLWKEYLQGFHPVGAGSAASAPPYVAVIAALATVLGGKPWLAVDVLLLGCVPLAGATAFFAARRVTRFVPARVWAALSYALLPVGMGAVAAGRLGTAVVLVLLPLAGVQAGRMFTKPRRWARRSAWATAFIVGLAAAFVPVVWPVVAVAVAAGVLAFGRGRPGSALNAVIIALAPPVMLMPWAFQLLTHPGKFFGEAGLAQPGLASPGVTARTLLLLSPGGPGLPPFWVTAGLVVAAAVAFVVSGRRALVLAGWGVTLIGLVAAAAVSRIIITGTGTASPLHAWPGAALAVAGAGLVLAGAAASDRIPARLRSGHWRHARGMVVLALAAVACSAPAAAATVWVVSGVRGPVAPAVRPLLPEFVAVSSQTGLRLRTLVLRPGPHGLVTYSLLRSADPVIGEDELGLPAAARRALNLCVATLTAPHGSAVQDQGHALAGFGIGYVLLPAPGNASLGRLLDGVPGLRPVSSTSEFQLWRVVDTTARVTVTEPDGTVAAVPSGTVNVSGAKAPAAGGTLVLAEPAGGWSATLNGHALTPVATPVRGWAQGFHLPSGGGSLSITHNDIGHDAAVVLETLIVLAVAGLGLPGARVAAEEAADAVPSPARTPGQGAARGRGKRSQRHGKAAPGTRTAGGRGAGAPALDGPGTGVAGAGMPGGRAAGGLPSPAAVGARGAGGLPPVAGVRGRGASPGTRGPGGPPAAAGARGQAAPADVRSPLLAPGGGLPPAAPPVPAAPARAVSRLRSVLPSLRGGARGTGAGTGRGRPERAAMPGTGGRPEDDPMTGAGGRHGYDSGAGRGGHDRDEPIPVRGAPRDYGPAGARGAGGYDQGQGSRHGTRPVTGPRAAVPPGRPADPAQYRPSGRPQPDPGYGSGMPPRRGADYDSPGTRTGPQPRRGADYDSPGTRTGPQPPDRGGYGRYEGPEMVRPPDSRERGPLPRRDRHAPGPDAGGPGTAGGGGRRGLLRRRPEPGGAGPMPDRDWRGPGRPERDDSPGRGAGRDTRRGVAKWLGRSSRHDGQSGASQRGGRPGDDERLSSLAPLPPPPPRAQRRQSFGERYSPPPGAPTDWDREEHGDRGEYDW